MISLETTAWGVDYTLLFEIYNSAVVRLDVFSPP